MYEEANKHVYDKMSQTINTKVFNEKSIELLPAYFILAEANIGMGGAKLKKAEEFLIAANWNLLKSGNSGGEDGRTGGADDPIVPPEEIKRYHASLNLTFPKSFPRGSAIIEIPRMCSAAVCSSGLRSRIPAALRAYFRLLQDVTSWVMVATIAWLSCSSATQRLYPACLPIRLRPVSHFVPVTATFKPASWAPSTGRVCLVEDKRTFLSRL